MKRRRGLNPHGSGHVQGLIPIFQLFHRILILRVGDLLLGVGAAAGHIDDCGQEILLQKAAGFLGLLKQTVIDVL